MARVSRKTLNYDVIEKTYKTALYTRLSVEQENGSSNDSMQNQIDIVNDYAKKNKDIVVFKTYQDMGFSGVNFDRPAFEDMMNDIIYKKVNCVIVKDFSRLGRNYIETGYLIEKTFKDFNVRFISVNDNYDSLIASSSDNTLLAFKNMVNNIYVKDLSRKVKSSLATKIKNGEYIGYTPYGFLKDETQKNKLIIDEVKAPVVRKMFELRADNKSYSFIAKYLNDNQIMPPSKTQNTCGIWGISTTSRILKSELYNGELVFNKSITNQNHIKLVPRNEWKKVSNCVPKLIDDDLFQKVQAVNEKRAITQLKKRDELGSVFLSKITYCGNCKIKTRKYPTNNGVTFVCYSKKLSSNNDCFSEKIFESELNEIVLAQIHNHIDLAFEYKQKMELLNKNKYKSKNKLEQLMGKKLDKINNSISKLNEKKILLYEQYFDSKISLKVYIARKEKIEHQEFESLNLLEEIKVKYNNDLVSNINNNEWIENLLLYNKDVEMTRELVDTLIDKIYIFSDYKIEIIWKFQSDLELLKKGLIE